MVRVGRYILFGIAFWLLLWLVLVLTTGCNKSQQKKGCPGPRKPPVTKPLYQRKSVVCPDCNGRGKCKPPAIWIANHPKDNREFECPMCGGSGKLYEEVCP